MAGKFPPTACLVVGNRRMDKRVTAALKEPGFKQKEYAQSSSPEDRGHKLADPKLTVTKNSRSRLYIGFQTSDFS